MKVCIFGSSGLVGNYLLEECLADKKVSAIKIFVRKNLALDNPKLQQIITTFNNLDAVSAEINGDIVFNCLGTTIKVAGSEQAQYEIDCEYPIKIAKIAAKNNIKVMVNVSSVGASLSGNFYLKTKAEMEAGVTKAIIDRAYFLRPSFLEGQRKEVRFWEKVGIYSFVVLNPLLVSSAKKYRSIQAKVVAKAMLNIALVQPKKTIFEYDDIVNIANN
jgi:uncharacterized protein YbjT (DUF2867 family)